MPVAIVTGGSRGLGEALVAGLLERGWSVVTDARDAGALATTADRLRAAVHSRGAGGRAGRRDRRASTAASSSPPRPRSGRSGSW